MLHNNLQHGHEQQLRLRDLGGRFRAPNAPLQALELREFSRGHVAGIPIPASYTHSPHKCSSQPCCVRQSSRPNIGDSPDDAYLDTRRSGAHHSPPMGLSIAPRAVEAEENEAWLHYLRGGGGAQHSTMPVRGAQPAKDGNFDTEVR